MPRTYVKKGKAPLYTADDVANAVRDVENEKMTYRQVKELYGVPILVIFNRIKGRKTSLDRMGAGRPQTLPVEVEKSISDAIVIRSKMGYPVDKDELKKLVGE